MLFSSILASTKKFSVKQIRTCAWQLRNNLKVSTLYKKLCQRFSLLLYKEGFLSKVCLIYVICFCNLRMWKDLNKSCLTSIKLCVSSFLCAVPEPILLPLKLWVYLHRFSALSFWGDGFNWHQTGFYSNPFIFAGYRNNCFF